MAGRGAAPPRLGQGTAARTVQARLREPDRRGETLAMAGARSATAVPQVNTVRGGGPGDSTPRPAPAASPARRSRAAAPLRLAGALLCAALTLAACAPLEAPLPAAALTAGIGAAQAVAPASPAPPSTAAAPTVAAPSFADVPPGNWAYPAIAGLARLGLLTGVSPGRFAPDAPVTRAEFAAVLARAMGAPTGTVGPSFSDVPSSAWYAPLVEAAAGLGWMRGPAPDTFQPDATVTRAEAAAAAVQALGQGHVADDEGGNRAMCPFTDCGAIPGWALGAADVLGHLGVLRGDLSGRFAPTSPLTRAEAAVLLWKLRGVAPAALAAEGQKVAAYIHLTAGAGVAEAGTQLTLHAYAHDMAGYIVPADFRWSVTGPARVVSSADGVAVVAMQAPGDVRVTASLANRAAVAASAAVQVMRLASISVQGLPPVGLAHAAFAVQVSARTASGGLDTAEGGVTATVVAEPAGGAAASVGSASTPAPSASASTSAPAPSASAPVQWGRASVRIPDLPAGEYSLTFQLPGAPAVQVPYRVVAHPLGAIQLTADTTSVATGGGTDVHADLPAANWPVEVAVSGTEPGPAALPGETPAPAVLTVASASAALPGPGVAAHVVGNAPGSGTVTVSVPGGALTAGTLPLRVQPAGAFGDALPSNAVTAGTAATAAIALSGDPGSVWLEPIDPAGHPLPWVAAAVSGGVAQAQWTPLGAGIWHLRWRASGALPVAAGSLAVLPGPAAQLVVDPSPTSVLLPGQTAALRAWIADRYGNPLPEVFRLRASASGGHGRWHLTLSHPPGPAAVGTFTAGTAGTTTIRFTSPDHPELAAVSVSMRTVAAPAERIAGKGLWLTFPDWKAASDQAIVADALAAGATHLYLEVATSSDGFYGARALDTLLPRAHAAGLSVLAWIYPALDDPAADTAILREVAAYRTPDGDAPDGLALDIEENLDPATVSAYARAADQAMGPNGLVVGVTWAPAQRPDYPYAALAGYVGAYAPMDYWHVNEADYSYAEVYSWVEASVSTIRRLSGRPDVPVEVIAGTFDWFAGGGGRGIFSPSAAEVSAAIQAASDAGAVGVSFYRESTATSDELAVINGTSWPPPG